VSLPGEDPDRDNFCTQYLAKLLGLPAPGVVAQEVSDIESLVAIVQFILVGTGGGEWYVVCDRGKVIRREGVADHPDTRVTLPAETWMAIQRGEKNHFQAWTSGDLQIEGDHTALHLLEALITRLSG